jgi:hypothetical protein
MTRQADAVPFRFFQRLKEIDLFFQRKDPIHQTLRRLARRLDRVGIPYAVVGGMAVNAHRYARTTRGVDLLLTPAGLSAFRKRFVGKQYAPVPGRPLRYIDRVNGVTIDFLLTGGFPGSGEPGPIAYPDPARASEIVDRVRVVDLPTLVELKLAARCHKDFGDIVELVRVHDLDETFGFRLHKSVRADFLECLEEKRREDAYEIRRGRLQGGAEDETTKKED